ncbi:MAG: MFS transporter [Acidimicrobiales bacterium]
MARVVNRLTVDDAGLGRLRDPRQAIIAERAGDDPDTFEVAVGPVRSYRRQLSVTPTSEDRFDVVETIEFRLAVPFFGWLFLPVLRRELRRHTHRTQGPDADSEPPQPWWAPPDRFDARAATVVSLLCVLALIGGYLGTLITQTITFAADSFDADEAAQGLTLALVRIGVLLALVISMASDRRGRRVLLLGTATAAILVAATGALAPDLVWLGTSQTVARGLSTALGLLIGIVAAEELPAGSRAYGVSVLALAAGLGAGMCVWFLPLADLGPDGWRILYVVPLLALPLVLRVRNLLPESQRFHARHGAAPVPAEMARLRLLAGAGFLASLFLAPASQFQNEFLRSERGFSATRISVFTLLTTTPAGIGVAVGGRLSDVRGRRRVAAVGLVGGVGFTVAAYLVAGWPLWVFSAVGSIVAAATVPALGVYGPELFPTSQRGRANGIITLVGVAGSSLGLLAAGWLARELGTFGAAMAVLAVGPLILAVLVLVKFPETAHRSLEDLNPGDAPQDDPAGR